MYRQSTKLQYGTATLERERPDVVSPLVGTPIDHATRKYEGKNVEPQGAFSKERIFKSKFRMLTLNIQTQNFAAGDIGRHSLRKCGFRTVAIHVGLGGLTF